MSGKEKREKMAIMETAISASLSHPNIVQVRVGSGYTTAEFSQTAVPRFMRTFEAWRAAEHCGTRCIVARQAWRPGRRAVAVSTSLGCSMDSCLSSSGFQLAAHPVLMCEL